MYQRERKNKTGKEKYYIPLIHILKTKKIYLKSPCRGAFFIIS